MKSEQMNTHLHVNLSKVNMQLAESHFVQKKCHCGENAIMGKVKEGDENEFYLEFLCFEHQD